MIPCSSARSLFPEYLDGAVSGADMHSIASHLENCEACAAEFAESRNLQALLASVAPVRPSADLGLRLRVAISQERARTSRRRLDVWQMHWKNSLAPMLARGAAGLASAVILLGTLALMIGTVAAPPSVAANEAAAGSTSTPRFLYAVGETDARIPARSPIVVEVEISKSGAVYGYSILSGPQPEAVRQQLDNFLLMSHFTPATFYGMPVPSRAVLTLTGARHRA